jgi:peptidoglycan pentaglycine glycine transferase (the first glycine)
MQFIDELTEQEYVSFYQNNIEKSHFLQSYKWSLFKSKYGYEKIVFGVKDNNELVMCNVILKRTLPLGFTYFYIPRGLILDYNNDSLLEFVLLNIKRLMKKNRAIYLKMDPAIKVDNNIIEKFKRLGFKHEGFTQHFELNQPRFTYRINLDLGIDAIIKNFDRRVNQRLKKANRYDISNYISEDIDKFISLHKMTENRKDFSGYTSAYYKDLYEMFKNNNAAIFLSDIDIDKSIEKVSVLLNEEEVLLKSLKEKEVGLIFEANKRIESLKEDLVKLELLKEKHGNNLTISGFFIIYYLNKAWVLYGANHDDFLFTNANYSLYIEHIKYAIDKNISIYDLFGTTGPNASIKELIGIDDFKKKFGGEFIEFIGEFTFIRSKFIYQLYKLILKIKKKLK